LKHLSEGKTGAHCCARAATKSVPQATARILKLFEESAPIVGVEQWGETSVDIGESMVTASGLSWRSNHARLNHTLEP